MNTLATMNLTMTSKEIADLTGKLHKNVMRDIEVMADQLGTSEQLKIEFLERINNLGLPVKDKHYLLNKQRT